MLKNRVYQSLLSLLTQKRENKCLIIYDFPMPAAVSWFFKNRYVVSTSLFQLYKIEKKMPVFCTRPFCGIVFDEEINLKEHLIKVHGVLIPLTSNKQPNFVQKDDIIFVEENPKKKIPQPQNHRIKNDNDNKIHLLNEGQKFFVDTILAAADSYGKYIKIDRIY